SLPEPGGPSSMSQLTAFAGKLYFVGCENGLGCELWSSNGSGLSRVKDINPGTPSSNPTVFQQAGGTLFFAATSQYLGRELFKTDGTAAGTVMVANSTVSYASTFIETAA